MSDKCFKNRVNFAFMVMNMDDWFLALGPKKIMKMHFNSNFFCLNRITKYIQSLRHKVKRAGPIVWTGKHHCNL